MPTTESSQNRVPFDADRDATMLEITTHASSCQACFVHRGNGGRPTTTKGQGSDHPSPSRDDAATARESIQGWKYTHRASQNPRREGCDRVETGATRSTANRRPHHYSIRIEVTTRFHAPSRILLTHTISHPTLASSSSLLTAPSPSSRE
jgi:hypothetical protein